MKKIVNFRFFTFLLLFSSLGIVSALFLYNEIIFDYIVVALATVLIFVILLILRKKGIIACAFILFFALFYLYTVSVLSFGISNKLNYDTEYLAVRVEYVSVDGSVMRCSFDEGKANLYIKNIEGISLKEGMNITIEDVSVRSVSILDDTGNYDFYALTQGERYSILADCVYSVNSFTPTLAESIRISIKDSGENLSEEVKGIVIALLTGDKYGISESTYTDYRRSGIAHILAVSGLHVVFLYSAINLILKKCRVRKKIRAYLSIPVLFLFSATCGFSPSVIRASVMTVMHSVIPASTNRRYDTLSVMSLSAVMLLLFNPMTLFSYGFLLSYVSVLGIVAYSKKFAKLLSFLPKFLQNSLSVSMSASLATFPLTAIFFGEVSIISALTNILILPVMSVFYGALFMCAMITAIFPFMGIILSACGLVVYYMNFVAALVASIPFATVSPMMPIWFTAGYYVCGVLLSDYVFMKKEIRACALILFVLLFVFYFVLCGKSLIG